MSLYCLVQNGQIVKGPQTLPRHWENMINFHLIENPGDHGWYLYDDTGLPTYSSDTERLTTETLINNTEKTVTKVHTVISLTNEEVVDRLEALKNKKIADVRNMRWEKETGGVQISPGVVIRTDEVSQSKIAGAKQLFDTDPTLEYIDWEVQPQIWTQLDANTVTAIGVAVGRHIQQCFSHSKTLMTTINAANTINTVNSIDITSGWPT